MNAAILSCYHIVRLLSGLSFSRRGEEHLRFKVSKWMLIGSEREKNTELCRSPRLREYRLALLLTPTLIHEIDRQPWQRYDYGLLRCLVISDPAFILRYKLWRETAQSLGRKQETEGGGATLSFLFRCGDIVLKKTHLC